MGELKATRFPNADSENYLYPSPGKHSGEMNSDRREYLQVVLPVGHYENIFKDSDLCKPFALAVSPTANMQIHLIACGESTSSFRTWIAIEEIFQSRNSFI
jgi:hypothetical protein